MRVLASATGKLALALLAGAALATVDAAAAGDTSAIGGAEARQIDELARDLAAERMVVRLRAVKALASMGRGSAAAGRRVRALLATAADDPEPAVATQAAAALARLAGADPVPPEVRRAHRLALEREEVDECAAALGSPRTALRLRAVKRLAAMADALAPERLVELLGAAERDPDPRVSAQAAAALSALARLSNEAR